MLEITILARSYKHKEGHVPVLHAAVLLIGIGGSGRRKLNEMYIVFLINWYRSMDILLTD